MSAESLILPQVVTLSGGDRVRITRADTSDVVFDVLGAEPEITDPITPEIVLAPAQGVPGGVFADLADVIAHLEAALPSPAARLAELKSEVRDIAKTRRTELIRGGFEFGGKRIQTRNQSDTDNIRSVALEGGANPAFATGFIAEDNSILALDAAGCIAMHSAMVAAGNAIFSSFIALSNQIEACADEAAVEELRATASTFTA